MDWREECRKVHTEGLNKLARDGRLPFLLRPYSDAGVHFYRDLILQNGIGDPEREKLRTITVELFRRTALPAALIQSDTYQVDARKFSTHFGLSAELSPEEYQEEYLRILDEKFKGTAENLPQELWTDGIITCIKGPKILPINFITSYHKDEDGALEFEDTDELAGAVINLLPDWWETTIN